MVSGGNLKYNLIVFEYIKYKLFCLMVTEITRFLSSFKNQKRNSSMTLSLLNINLRDNKSKSSGEITM